MELRRCIDVGREYDSKTAVLSYQLGHDRLLIWGNLQIQMPIDMAMWTTHQKGTREKNQNLAPVQNPWSRVIRCEPERNVVARSTGRDDITPHWISIVVTGITSAPNDVKRLLAYCEPPKLNSKLGLTPCKWKGCYIRKLKMSNLKT